MNAKEEILDLIDNRREQKDMPLAYSVPERIREILSRHELVPIEEGTKVELIYGKKPDALRRECLAPIEEAERRAKDNGMGDAAYRNAVQRLKLFLRDGKTSFHHADETERDYAFGGEI